MAKTNIDNDDHFLFIVAMAKEIRKQTSQPALYAPGQIIDVIIKRLNEEGVGCADTENGCMMVAGALPGEHVRVKIVRSARQSTHGSLVKILRHSPARVMSPACSSSSCDGCPLVVMKYQAQLAWKTEVLTRELQRFFPPDQLAMGPILPSPKQTGYRNSAKLVITGKFSNPIIGIYRKNSHDVVDISDCPLHHPLINTITAAVKEGIKKGKVPIYSARTGNGLLRYLAVRVSEETGRGMVIFVSAARSYNEIHHLAKHLVTALPQVTVVVQNVNSSSGNVIFGQKDYFLSRETSLTDNIGPIRFLISPRSFFQINSGGARLIYEQVREFAQLTGSEKVLDLYCGVGGISFYLAGQAKEVLGIESVPSAVADAEQNAILNNISNCRFIAGDTLANLTKIPETFGTVDLIVLNPPRKGCDQKVLLQAAALSPRRMIYVSCSPRSLAQDLSILYKAGYRPRSIQPIDMFPQTPHMETVVLLERS